LAWVYFDLGTILCILWRSLEEKRSIPLWFANQGGGWNEKMVQLVMKTGQSVSLVQYEMGFAPERCVFDLTVVPGGAVGRGIRIEGVLAG
jgi:hypothetical protein